MWQEPQFSRRAIVVGEKRQLFNDEFVVESQEGLYMQRHTMGGFNRMVYNDPNTTIRQSTRTHAHAHTRTHASASARVNGFPQTRMDGQSMHVPHGRALTRGRAHAHALMAGYSLCMHDVAQSACMYDVVWSGLARLDGTPL